MPDQPSPTDPIHSSESFADLVEQLRRPTGPSRGSEWRGTESVSLPAALESAVAAFVETHRRRGIRPSRWPFAGNPPALLIEQCTRAQETYLVEALARRLVRRLYSFDMREGPAAVAQLGEPSPIVVHLHALDTLPPSDVAALIAALRAASSTVAIVGTATARAALDPALVKCFALKLTWPASHANAGAPGRTARDVPLPS